MQSKNLEIKVGFVIFLCMVMLVALLVIVGGRGFLKNAYEVKVRFALADGLENNAPVRFAGVEKGKVTGIRIIPEEQASQNDKARVEVTLMVDKDLVLHEDSRIRLGTAGLMGGKYVSISPGTIESPKLKPGDVLRGEDPLEITDLLEDGRNVLANLKDITTGLNDIISNNKDEIDETIVNLWDISNALSKNLEGILTKMEDFLNNADTLVTLNQEDIRETIENLRDTTQNAKEFTRKINEKPNAIIWGYKEKKSAYKERRKR